MITDDAVVFFFSKNTSASFFSARLVVVSENDKFLEKRVLIFLVRTKKRLKAFFLFDWSFFVS